MTLLKNNKQDYYQSNLSRRESLKWLAALSATAMLPTIAGCTDKVGTKATSTPAKGHWQLLTLEPVSNKGYGKDPNLILPPKSPWPKTLSAEQLTLVAMVSDILVPREGEVPSASEVKVPDVIDEWVSAPYQRQQRDRVTILSLLGWLEREAKLRFSQAFAQLSSQQQLAIIDDIAFDDRELAPEFVEATKAFFQLKRLVLAAFFCSPQGTKDIGYQGNVAIAGDYPGPTTEALSHLDSILDELGLSLP